MDAITQAYRALGKFASEIEPSRIDGFDFEPTRQGGKDFIYDLVQLCEKVDTLIQACGDYCYSRGVVHQHDLKENFKDQLRGALEGRAFFCIESGIEERIEGNREAAE